ISNTTKAETRTGQIFCIRASSFVHFAVRLFQGSRSSWLQVKSAQRRPRGEPAAKVRAAPTADANSTDGAWRDMLCADIFAERKLCKRVDHCGLMPANLIPPVHLSMFLAMNLANSSGEFGGTATAPRVANCCLMFGSSTAALVCWLSAAMISDGV